MPEPQPILMKVDLALAAAEGAKGMNVAIADAAPILEVDAELEGRASRRHEVGFIDSETLIEAADVRQRRFADSDDPDLLRLDEMNRAAGGQECAQPGGGHPAGGPAADDDNANLW